MAEREEARKIMAKGSSSRSSNNVEKEEKITAEVKGGSDKERDKALEAAVSHIERAFGKGSIMKMGDASAKMSVERSESVV